MKLSQKDFKESLNKLTPFLTGAKSFIVKNLRYIIVAILFILLIILLVKCTSDEKDKSNTGKEESATSQESENETIESADDSTTSEEGAEEAVEIPNDLQTDMYPEVNSVVNSYYAAIASSDTATLSSIVKSLSEEEMNQLIKRREYIENYQNIVTYTKNGPVPNSYVVFAYHEIKFVNINTLAPGLELLYVYTDETGATYIFNGDMDEVTAAYITDITTHEDVVSLYSTVDAKFQEAQTADPDLKAFVEQLNAVASTAEESTQVDSAGENATEPSAEDANQETPETVTE